MSDPNINPRRLVKIDAERVRDVASSDFPGHYPGEDNSWNLEAFKSKLVTQINRLSESEIEFDLVGVDAAIANAFRRIMIAEIPTIAVEHVYVFNNTSIIMDEVLSHRLGLVPIKFDPRKLEWQQPGDSANDQNTVVFNLQVKCERNKSAKKGETDPDKLYINHKVLSRDLVWNPQGGQAEDPLFTDDPPRAMDPDILLAKMRPGQELDLELHCVKGIGQDHAKFSPVATATYRLLPHIKLHAPIPSAHADLFASCFAPGVVRVSRDPATGEKKAEVVNPRRDTVSREVLRHKEFEGIVQLGRVRDHFIFSVESTGAYAPEEMLPQAISVLRDKIHAVRKGLDGIMNPAAAASDAGAGAEEEMEES